MLIDIKKFSIEGLKIQFNGETLFKYAFLAYLFFAPTATGNQSTMPKERQIEAQEIEQIQTEQPKQFPKSSKNRKRDQKPKL
jgi:hypothetical protein